MNFHDRLMQMLESTQAYQDLTEKEKANVHARVRWARTLGHDPAMYIARIFQRFFIMLSDDVPGSTKWANRAAAILKDYDRHRITADFFHFAKPTNQFAKVYGDYLAMAGENSRVRQALDSIRYVGADGKDLPFDEVYASLNSIGEKLTKLEQLKPGKPIIDFPNGSKWVEMDSFGDSIEGALMRHCFSGDTEVMTKDGVATLKDLAKVGTADLLTTQGWLTSTVKSFGLQPLLRVCVAFTDQVTGAVFTEDIYATAKHQWLVCTELAEVKLPSATTYVPAGHAWLQPGHYLAKFNTGATMTSNDTARVHTQDLEPGQVLLSCRRPYSDEVWYTAEVRKVEQTGRVAEVFCAVVPLVHHFTLKRNLVTGNCGNSGGRQGDVLWSYRVPSNAIKGKHEPKLTFIFNPKGKALGEMKGFANSKPAADLHPYIVALLKTGLVKKLVGNGYLPERNFCLNDLSDALFTELYHANPDLVEEQKSSSDEYQKLDKHHLDLLKGLESQSKELPSPKKKAKKPEANVTVTDTGAEPEAAPGEAADDDIDDMDDDAMAEDLNQHHNLIGDLLGGNQ